MCAVNTWLKFNTLLIFTTKIFFLLWGGLWEGKFPNSICGFLDFFFKQYKGGEGKKQPQNWLDDDDSFFME